MAGNRFHIVVLAVALLFVNVWCVAQCTTSPTPCCPKHHQTVKPCASSVAVEAVKTDAGSPLGVIAIVQAGAVDAIVFFAPD